MLIPPDLRTQMMDAAVWRSLRRPFDPKKIVFDPSSGPDRTSITWFTRQPTVGRQDMRDALLYALSHLAAHDRERCPVVRITIHAHPTSSAHEVATFAGGRVVVKAGRLRTGAICAFLPAGTLLSDWLLKSLSLWDDSTGYGRLRGPERNRVFAERVHGILSQGLLYKGTRPGYLHGEPVIRLTRFARGYAEFRDHREGQCAAAFLGATPPRAELFSKISEKPLHTGASISIWNPA